MTSVRNIYPLAPLQRGLWFTALSDPDSRVYHQQLRLGLRGPLDVRALRRTFAQLVERHDVLRTAFEWEELDEPLQLVVEDVELPFREVDLRGAASPDALSQLAAEEHARAFDLRQAPLMRVCLARVAEDAWECLWTHHHIILDGWSVGILLQEWRALFRGERLPAAPPYAAFIAWLEGRDRERARKHFQALLRDVAEPTPLPRLLPETSGGAGTSGHTELSLTLSGAFTQAIEARARALETTPSVLYIAAFGLLLARHAGRDDAVIGVTVSGRPTDLRNASEMVGVFINTLPVRIRASADVALTSVLRDVRTQLSHLHEYSYCTLAEIKRASALASAPHLFEAIVVVENYPVAAGLTEPVGALQVSIDEASAELGRNHQPLSLIVANEAGRSELTLSYAQARYQPSEIGALLQQLSLLVCGLAERPPSDSVANIAHHAEPERERLLALGRGPEIALPVESLHAVVERHARVIPDALAVVSDAAAIDYRELDAAANRLSRYLAAQGVEPGAVVALAMSRSVDFVVAMLAVFKRGAAYLPLELAQPMARLRELVADSGAKLVLSVDRRWTEFSAPVVCLEDVRDQIAALACDAVTPLPAADAYLVYTSGSTGKPKAVVVPHRAISAYTASVLTKLEIVGPQRFAWLSTVAADLGHTQLFGALMSGGTLCAVDERTAFDPLALAERLAQLEPDVLKLTPGHLRGLLDAHESAELLPARELLFGGEALDGALVARVRKLRPELRVYNHYGPTETAVGAVCWEIPREPFSAGVPLGRPLPNRHLYVLDAAGEPVPEGVVGQLFIGGDATAREYLGEPQLTSERFLPDPFRGEGRMYATGDRVRWLIGGVLEFIGRSDAQVKLRGYRIELGEVEAAIMRACRHVREVWARVVPAANGTQRLCAYYVASTPLSPEKLRDDLSLIVPDPMIPSSFVALDALPRTPNGKRDFRGLPTAVGVERFAEVVAPRDEIERTLHAIWCAVLSRDQVSVRDNFLAVGGDSILSLQIIARSRRQGLAITPKQLFELKTIERLARALVSDGWHEVTPRSEVATTERVPLTPAQRRLLALDAGPSFRLIRLPEGLREDALARALDTLTEAHVALRARFETSETGAVFQSDPGPGRCVLMRVELALDDEGAIAALVYGIETFSAWLCGGAAAGERALLLAAPPLCLDDSGWSVVLADVRQVVADLEAARAPKLRASGTDLFGRAKFVASWVQRDDIDDVWQYWLDQAHAHAPAESQRESGEPRTLALSIEDSARLLEICRGLRAPLMAAVTAALAALEQHASRPRGSQIVIDVPAGRHALTPGAHHEGEPYLDLPSLVGALTHHAPLLLDAASEAERESSIARIATALAERAPRLTEYGALRFVSDNEYLLESLLALPRARIAVSWLGTLDGVLAFSRDSASRDYALHVRVYVRDERVCLACEGPLARAWVFDLERELLAFARGDMAQPTPAHAAFPLCSVRHCDVERAGLERARVEDVYPLSAMQHGMLLHTLLAPHSGIYLMQQHYEWRGRLERDALDAAWAGLVAQHPVLRTAFLWQDDRAPVQCVYREVETHVEWFDLSQDDEPHSELQRVLQDELTRGYDLRRAPLTLLRVFRMGDEQFVIVRSFHHILMDAWCFGLVMEELLARYRALVQNQRFERVAPRPFRDYIAWLAVQDMAAAERFYRERFSGLSQLTPLPGAPRPKPAPGGESAVDHVDVTLTVELSNALDAACRAHELTANTWVQGAWALLLAHHARSSDVVFGVTTSGRPAELSGVEDMLGLFINSLPLRVNVGDAVPLDVWLRELLAHNLELRRYEYAPLVDIARFAGHPGESLFETLVVFENAPLGAAETSAFGVQLDFEQDRVHTNFPITVVVYPGQPLGLRLSYDVARYDRAQVVALQDQLVQMLAQMVESPHAALETFALAGPAQLARLRTWNDTAAPFPLDRTYAALLGERVARAPEHVVACCNGAAWTYAELWRRSGVIARDLVVQGVTKDSIVVVAAERSLALVALLVGVLRARGAFLALELTQPDRRLAEIVRLSDAAHAVVAPGALEVWRRVAAQLPSELAMIVAREDEGDADVLAPVVAGAPDDLAYVVFTSGSTGVPKGVMIEQRGMLNNMFGKLPWLGIDARDRIAQTASVAFDISIWQLLTAPLLGACVEIFPDDISHDPARLRAALASAHVSIAEVVPAVMKAMLDAEQPELPALRWLLTTGEAVSPSLCRAWHARFPKIRLLNAYGPAECSDDVAMHEVRATDGFDASVPVGRPTPNNQLYVLDASLRPLPPYALGEIAVGGAGVGRGYLGDPELTRRAFVEVPWLDRARLYLTGDLGRFRDDGVLELAGRKDEQVKVRGHRIELSEIELRLASLDRVREAAVVCVHDARGDAFLAAYCELASGGPIARETVLAQLGEQLPHYMVPSSIAYVAELPRTENGKIDRNALRSLGVPAVERERPQAPRDAREAELHRIWRAVLERDDIGVLDNFFAIGGHSLLATQVVSRIQRRFGVSLPLRALFVHPTIAELASAIARAETRDTAIPPLTAQERGDLLPLSFAQQRLWFLEQLHTGSSAFNLGFALRMTGALDVAALRDALAFVIERHEILRASFSSQQGEPRQRILANVSFALEVASPQGSASSALEELAARPFDLARPPLLRARLLRSQEHDHVLLLVVHHIVVDAWSLGLFVEELTRAYVAFRNGLRPDGRPPELSYADYAIWQRRPELSASWQTSLEYFRNELRDCPARLSLRGSRAGGQDHRAERVRVRGDGALREQLARAAQRHSATPFMLLHAALSVVVRQQSGSSDFLIGTDVANRSELATEQMIGFFVNQLVLRSRVQDDEDVTALIEGSRATILSALEHQELPFDRLVAELLPERDRRAMPFFQLKLILQNTPDRVLELPELQIEELESPTPDAELDLLVSVEERSDGLDFVIDYRRARFERAYVEQLGSLLVLATRGLCDPSRSSVGALVARLEREEQSNHASALERARVERDAQRQQLAAARRRRSKT